MFHAPLVSQTICFMTATALEYVVLVWTAAFVGKCCIQSIDRRSYFFGTRTKNTQERCRVHVTSEVIDVTRHTRLNDRVVSISFKIGVVFFWTVLQVWWHLIFYSNIQSNKKWPGTIGFLIQIYFWLNDTICEKSERLVISVSYSWTISAALMTV